MSHSLGVEHSFVLSAVDKGESIQIDAKSVMRGEVERGAK